jgi:hypothetical protein
MITLVNKFAAKLEDKKGSLTEDEVSQSFIQNHDSYICTCAVHDHLYTLQTIQFKSYLLSVGIANPVTRWRITPCMYNVHIAGSNILSVLVSQNHWVFDLMGSPYILIHVKMLAEFGWEVVKVHVDRKFNSLPKFLYSKYNSIIHVAKADAWNSYSFFRETHGSGSTYHKELSKQLAGFLDKPLKVMCDVHVLDNNLVHTCIYMHVYM